MRKEYNAPSADPLQFKNVLGLLKISLTGSSRVYKISVSDGDAERMLWGTAKLLLDGNQGTSDQTLELTGGDNTVNLLCRGRRQPQQWSVQLLLVV